MMLENEANYLLLVHFTNYVRGSVGRFYVEFSSKMLRYLILLLTVFYLLFYMKKIVLLA